MGLGRWLDDNVWQPIGHAGEWVADEFDAGPKAHAAAARARATAMGDADKLRQLEDELAKNGYDPAVANDYYQGQAGEIQKGYYDQSGAAASSMAQRGLGNSGQNTALQLQASNNATNNRAQAMRASVTQARGDRRSALLGAAGLQQGIYNNDSSLAAAADERRRGASKFLTGLLGKAGGAAIGTAFGNPMAGAAIGGSIGDSLGGGGDGYAQAPNEDPFAPPQSRRRGSGY